MNDTTFYEKYKMTLVKLIKKEWKNQDIKFPNQKHNIFKWLTIISEEIGELNKEVLELPLNHFNFFKVKNEIIQCITLLTRIYFTPYSINLDNNTIII